MRTSSETLAINGGDKTVVTDPGDMFHWPIVTKEDEEAVVQVLRDGAMSGNPITKQFEQEYAEWMGMDYALAYPNGTEALRSAMWACEVGAGDEIICPSMTYWASAAPALSLGAAVNFADIQRETLCIDPDDIEHRIGPKTKAIVVVHYSGYPCDMDRIMEIADRHKVKVIEDVSHAHGALYKGRKVGTFGHVSAMSMMAGKAFAIGEGGMLVTNDRVVYERCIAYGFYERTGVRANYTAAEQTITMPELQHYAGAPIGTYKHRINQTCAAMGRVQLRYYDERMGEIQKALNYFWDLLEEVPGVRGHRPAKDSGSTMGGWYNAKGLYYADELHGLPAEKFCEALRAEGFTSARPGANKPLHLHNLFHDADLFRMGKPTMISFGQRDVRQGPGTLKTAESIDEIAFTVPWFKHYRPEVVREYADAIKKVATHHEQLL